LITVCREKMKGDRVGEIEEDDGREREIKMK